MQQAYLNLETARRRYQAIRIAKGQTPAGGLLLLQKVQETYPGVPMVTYTRKGTIEEAEQARQAGARRVLQKPSAEDWPRTRQLTARRRPLLEEDFRRAMKHDVYEILTLIAHYAALLCPRSEREQIARTVASIRWRLLQTANAAVEAEDVDRLMEYTGHPFVRALIFQLHPDVAGPRQIRPNRRAL